MAGVASLLLVQPASSDAAPDVDLASTVAPDAGRTCRSSRVPVDLEVALPLTPGSDLTLPVSDIAGPQEVLVKLCLPDGGRPSAVQLLVHGITYDHRYWNIADPEDPASSRYSWEAAAAEAGYATLAIDRIGNGQSSHPLSAFVTIDSNAAVVQQLVDALRAGTIPSPGARAAFDRVVLVGHSYGSMTSWFTASRYQDVDGLVITSATHNIREVGTPLGVEGHIYPAMLDPQFAGMNLDPGYFTTRPGTRGELFHAGLHYGPGTEVHPTIIERDEAAKGTLTQFEIYNYPIIFRTPLDVRVPVLLLIGDQDGLFCSATPLDLAVPCATTTGLIANEAPWYGPHAQLDAVILPTVGHDINAFPRAPQAFAAAMAWLGEHVPPE